MISLNLPQRKLQRLKNFDYSQNGAYFITICTHEKAHLFGEIVDGQMELNEYGKIVEKHIEKVNKLYDGVIVKKYCIMPNHIHIIIVICRERIACVPQFNSTKMIIPKIIQSFKSSITKEFREIKGTHTMRSLLQQQSEIWQKSYHDHIIRNEAEYDKIWQYIDTNTFKWELDKYYF